MSAGRQRSIWPNIPPSRSSKHSSILTSTPTSFPRTISCSRCRLRTPLRSRNSTRPRSLPLLPTGAMRRTTRARSHARGLASDAPRCCECHRQSCRLRLIICSTRSIPMPPELAFSRGRRRSSTPGYLHDSPRRAVAEQDAALGLGVLGGLHDLHHHRVGRNLEVLHHRVGDVLHQAPFLLDRPPFDRVDVDFRHIVLPCCCDPAPLARSLARAARPRRVRVAPSPGETHLDRQDYAALATAASGSITGAAFGGV